MEIVEDALAALGAERSRGGEGRKRLGGGHWDTGDGDLGAAGIWVIHGSTCIQLFRLS